MAPALTPDERTALLPPLLDAGWAMQPSRDAITKHLKFKNFSQAWAAMSRIALLAEAMDHHPEWANVYNRLDITLTTHSAKGLSVLDINLARKIDQIAAEMGAGVAA
jgi:4a-hydroxytetrahydrobiopterin dehydratase